MGAAILETLQPFPARLISRILFSIVKPLFALNTHPGVNLSSGRKLPRLAGGQSAAFDFIEEQVWKTRPEVGVLVRWCVENLEVSCTFISFYFITILRGDREGIYRICGIFSFRR